MTMAGTGFYSDADIIALLNYGRLDFPVPTFSLSATNEAILGFSNHLSGMGALSLLHANGEMISSVFFTLRHLQNTIEMVLATTGVNQKNQKHQYSYVCQKCDETLTGNSIIDIWENHSHFDELLTIALSNNGDLAEIEDENEELEDQTEYDNDQGLHEVNNFKFNFDVTYDTAIQQKIYPSLFLSTMKKFEKLNCYTLQRISPHRSTCLLCSCELLMVRGKINQKGLVDHIVGQRHLNFTASDLHLLALQEYHETFLSLEVPYQAHQVYFQPKLHRKTRCELCKITVRTKLIRYHISSSVHKNCFTRMIFSKEQEFYLTDYQAMVYRDDHLISEIMKLQKHRRASVETGTEDESKKSIAQPKAKPKKPASAPTEEETLLHDIRIAVENPESSSILERTPKRYEDHMQFLKEQEQKVFCGVCREHVDKNVEKIILHIKKPSHKSMSSVPLKKFSYYCYVCNFKIFTEHQWRRHFMEFYDRHIPRNSEVVYVEYECVVCQLVFFGDSDQSVHHHVSQANKKKKKKTVTKLPVTVQKLFQSKLFIQEEGERLSMEAEAVVKDELTLKCCEQVENVLKSIFTECKVYPFGSRISGLGNKDSDLDMFLDSGGMYSGRKTISSHEQVLLVKKVYSILVKLKEEFSNVVEISTARTPIVKFKHIGTNIDCDLSFKHGLSVENTKFLKFCLALQPIAQPFILILKSWSSFNCLNEKISTYALAILAIFYLQLDNYLLSIREIRQLDPTHVEIIGGWETINYPKSIEEMRGSVKLYPHDICKLLHDFFSYYHSFPVDQDVVCPLLGTTIRKEQFIRDGKNGKSLPLEMKRYVDQLGSQEAEIFKAASPFCIQDPFDLSHNLAKACDKNLVAKFQCLCRLSLFHMNSLE